MTTVKYNIFTPIDGDTIPMKPYKSPSETLVEAWSAIIETVKEYRNLTPQDELRIATELERVLRSYVIPSPARPVNAPFLNELREALIHTARTA